ncbi:hypothetical protein D7294_29615 [Streptomyces hoynatensis]|uniref:Hint domain-containing protein n=2 Tax=Streptomyces hoynatensis TaxID=1141874 RepID=A0A3A9YJ14_9ACTN|nr:hypothetical protein D7294_29615 [Streptomyces hoynatensis]
MSCTMLGLTLATGGSGRGAALALRHADDVVDAARHADDVVDAARHGDDVVDAVGSCLRHSFLAGTDVLLADGTRKDIDDLEVGDTILATDPETGQTVPRRVVATIITDSDKEYTELTVTDAEGEESTLVATSHHPFWDEATHTWTNAADLTPGAQLHTPDGTTATVTATHTYHATARTYDLTVESTHTYYVLAGSTPVLVHNSNCNPIAGSSDAQRLADELRLASANSPFTPGGQLTQEALDSSRVIMQGSDMGNRELLDRFAERGGVAQWGKYSTPTHQSPYGDFQVHFYRNSVTGEVMYDYDYKVVMNRR